MNWRPLPASVPTTLILAMLAAHPAAAQTPGASPFAPATLKAPIFDTQTPNYTGAAPPAGSGVVVAEVDGRAVTLGNVGDAIAELPPTVQALPFNDLYPGIIDQLVRQQALVIRAQQKAVDEDPVVRRKIKAATDRVLANALLEQEIATTITEAALLQRYNRDYAGKPGPDQVHVRVIMLATQHEAMDIIAALHNGADLPPWRANPVAMRRPKSAATQDGQRATG